MGRKYFSPSIKRLIDVFGSLAILLLLIPVFIYAAIKIKKEDQGPIFFKQLRVGKGLENFEIYKFRTMVVNAEEIMKNWENIKGDEWELYKEGNFKLKNDPRLLKIGGVLRSSSIDELPQLLNVLKGEMTLVGPRPLLPREKFFYGEEELNIYSSVTPGMTGLWQISGRSDTLFKDRVALDLIYIEKKSLLLDFKILLKTLLYLCSKDNGAY
jgi:lipopolysaccharide/colanic/teichoic acid biosynthesis glycosyltransferase